MYPDKNRERPLALGRPHVQIETTSLCGTPGAPGCIAAAVNCVASRTPLHAFLATGPRNRRPSTGGSANGTPRKILDPPARIPSNLPLRVETVTKSSSAISLPNRNATPVAAACVRKFLREIAIVLVPQAIHDT